MKNSLHLSFCAVAALVLCGCNKPEENPSDPTPATNATPAAMSSTSASSPLADVSLSPASGSNVRGTVSFVRDGGKVRVEAHVTGLTPGQHGFHIHEKGDCSAADATSAGGHFNPSGASHGGPDDSNRHAGDFGNLEADASGTAHYSKTFDNLQFEGDASVIGKAVIVHGSADDLKTQPSGNAGSRVACGVIEKK